MMYNSDFGTELDTKTTGSHKKLLWTPSGIPVGTILVDLHILVGPIPPFLGTAARVACTKTMLPLSAIVQILRR
jgi:hypothetical protein|tara:strand:+ start:332 stop:553 length:222 start_codon:yes stop_codon:yes gene_type:complete